MKWRNPCKMAVLIWVALWPLMVFGQPAETEEMPVAAPAQKVTLGAATVCEEVLNGAPLNKAVAFSADLKRVYCYTNFTDVPQNTFAYHNWYLKDKLKASIKLALRPPRWSTYSSMQLRSSDKGPWRIEVTDEEGNILKTLRFSVID